VAEDEFPSLIQRGEEYYAYLSWSSRPDGHGGSKGGTIEEFRSHKENKLRQLFKNRSNCYADTREENHDTVPPIMVDGPVVMAMDEDCFIATIKEARQKNIL